MSREKFRDTKFKPESLERIRQANEILAEYGGQRLTARQAYYQFVARGLLANNLRNYKNLTNLLTDARYAGLLDWSAIEDRGRVPDFPPEWSSLESLMNAALNGYRLPRWANQENYVECWCEKQALVGVLAPIARKWHVTILANKGYSSASTMKEAADRMISEAGDGKHVVLLYLGDHDPSGMDMTRDIYDRLVEFGVDDLEVDRLALTIEQVRQYNPPPNPAKLTDSRAQGYIDQFGDESWELDALPPRVLNRLLEDAILERLDEEEMNKVKAQEQSDKERLRAALATLKKG